MSPLPLGAAAGSQTILFFGLLIFGGVSLLVVITAIRRNREATKDREATAYSLARARRLRRPEPLPYPINVRLGYDGFWLESPSLPAGALIYYECTFETKVRRDRVRYAPHANGHFIYSGEKPLGVQVVRVVLPGEMDDGDRGIGIETDVAGDSGESSAAAAAWHFSHGHHQPDDLSVDRGHSPSFDPPAY